MPKAVHNVGVIPKTTKNLQQFLYVCGIIKTLDRFLQFELASVCIDPFAIEALI